MTRLSRPIKVSKGREVRSATGGNLHYERKLLSAIWAHGGSDYAETYIPGGLGCDLGTAGACARRTQTDTESRISRSSIRSGPLPTWLAITATWYSTHSMARPVMSMDLRLRRRWLLAMSSSHLPLHGNG